MDPLEGSEGLNRYFVLILGYLKWIPVQVLVTLYLTYLLSGYTLSYIGSKAYSLVVTEINPKPLRVGETISLRISFTKLAESGEVVPCTARQFAWIRIFLTLGIPNTPKPVTILETISGNELTIQFSLRVVGVYKIVAKCLWIQFIGSPFEFDLQPGPVHPPKCCLQVVNPSLICLVVNKWHDLEIKAKDLYGNPCTFEQRDSDAFRLEIKQDEVLLSETSDEIQFNFTLDVEPPRLGLRIKLNHSRIYKGRLTFKGVPLAYGSNFTLVGLTDDEDRAPDTLDKCFLNCCFNKGHNSARGTLLFIGNERQDLPGTSNSIQVTINKEDIRLATIRPGCSCFVLPSCTFCPFLTFPINRKSKITYTGPMQRDLDADCDTIGLRISDGIQPPAVVRVATAYARILLATFAYYQGIILIEKDFHQKKQIFIHKLNGFTILRLPLTRKSLKILTIDEHKNLLASTMRQVQMPDATAEWHKPWFIVFCTSIAKTVGKLSSNKSSEPKVPQAEKKTNLTTLEWIALLLDELFVPGPSSLFCHYRSSRLLHPNLGSGRSSRWERAHYEFAGSILGKCLFDSLTNKFCVKLTHLRFSISLLAMLLGNPVTYQHFKTDDPDFYFDTVEPVINSELDVLPNRFIDMETTHPHVIVNLVPNGRNVHVTKRNKEKYLNLLANHRMVTPFKAEIDQFRMGFYKVIPSPLLADFDEDELEKLLCGGRRFTVKDMKAHCRIETEVQGSPYSSRTLIGVDFQFSDLDKKKMIDWLWVILANLDADEEERFLRMTIGSLVLPACGFKDLEPRFTVTFTGNVNQWPEGYPSLHQLALGKHFTFEKFEEDFLDAINSRKNNEQVVKDLVK